MHTTHQPEGNPAMTTTTIERLGLTSCAICGWDLEHPIRGRTVARRDCIDLQANGQAFAIHAVCLMRDGIALGGRVANLLNLVDDQDGVTPEGRRVLETGRIA